MKRILSSLVLDTALGFDFSYFIYSDTAAWAGTTKNLTVRIS